MATAYTRSFTWEKCAKETLEVYKKINNKNKIRLSVMKILELGLRVHGQNLEK